MDYFDDLIKRSIKELNIIHSKSKFEDTLHIRIENCDMFYK
jgi:hypothetical protein